MRFMVLMIPGVYQPGKKVDPNFAPDPDKMAAMSRFNEELVKEKAILSLDGLKPLSTGARLTYAGGKAKVTDGPFIESKEVLGGYWILEAGSKEQVIEWMKRCPAEEGDTIEIRPIFAEEDFPSEIRQKRAALRGGTK